MREKKPDFRRTLHESERKQKMKKGKEMRKGGNGNRKRTV